MATLTVGAGQAYATLCAAGAASRDRDVIASQAGTDVNDIATISRDITIVAGIDMAVTGNSTSAQTGGTAPIATVAAAACSTANLQNQVVVHG